MKKTTKRFLNTSEILANAAKIAKTLGHSKGDLYDLQYDGAGRPRSCCALGAICVALKEGKTRLGSRSVLHAANRALIKAGAFKGKTLEGVEGIIDFNDLKTTTKEEVVAILRKASRLTRKK